jgi:ATP-grasp domain-containing protein
MPTVVFAAPYFLEATLRFVDAAASLPDVRFGLVSHDPEDRLPEPIRRRLSAQYRVDNALDPEQLAVAVRGLATRLGPVDRLIGSLEELQVPLAEARAALGIPGMSVETAHNFRDKARMKSLLRAAGLPCARHGLAHTPAEALAIATDMGFPVVVKPPAGAGARDTFRVDDAARVNEWLSAMPPTPARPALIEEFITGDEHSFDSVFVGGQPVWHSISRYHPTPLDVLQNPWIQWCVVLPREIDGPAYDPIRHAAAQALRTLGLETGLTHMEWFRRRDGSVAISEVAARPPGAQFTTLISLAHDFDLYRAWAHLLVFETFPSPPRRWAVGAAFLRGQGRGRVRAIHGLDEAQRELGGLVVEAKLPRAGQPPSGGYEGEGHVIVRHADTAVVERALARLVSVIRVELGD